MKGFRVSTTTGRSSPTLTPGNIIEEFDIDPAPTDGFPSNSKTTTVAVVGVDTGNHEARVQSSSGHSLEEEMDAH